MRSGCLAGVAEKGAQFSASSAMPRSVSFAHDEIARPRRSKPRAAFRLNDKTKSRASYCSLPAPRSRPSALTAEERAAIVASRAAAARGEFATDDEVRAVWARHNL